jgi:hypothetical protein
MTNQQIADQLKALSVQMVNIGTAMDYYGGLHPHMAKRGAELVHAGSMTLEWAEEIEHELRGNP